ncbi:hypothetical protein EGM88_01295 [Aureibaculum marinum]|uniref:Uncharacterized protein n=1 Tax=Aureibaculum marinum TaxID=2487930 RepID=A0A3N4P882_9FLAO|nr:hypothetical protein [Aureibaculum marinum]RPD99929.1 hypothetical protein EGM88_01295 [Aureibaculum marinum]
MTGSIIYEVLNKSKNEKELIGIWQYGDSNSFLMGRVIDFNDDLVLFKHYTKFGKPDGIIALQMEAIQNIDYNDDYTKAMECLIEYSSILDKEPDFEFVLNNSEYWEADLIKQLAENNDIIASLEINDDYYSGYVTRATETDFELHCVGKMGEDEGKVVFRIEDVTEFKIHDLSDRKKDLLFRWRKAIL